VTSFIETHLLADARIGDAEMARMVNQHFHFEEAPMRSEKVSKIRRKLRIFYRPPFRVQDLEPKREAARMTFVSLMLVWLKCGRIKHLIFSDETRFWRGPDCLWA
jgi:hypothetical protein